MALASYSGAGSFNQTDGTHLDLSDELSTVLLADTFLLGRISMSGQAEAVDHYWMEDSLLTTTVTGNAAMDASETTLTVVANANVQIGTLLQDQTLGKQEVMQVTALTSGTAWVVTRGVGDSAPAGETHANGALYRIIGQPKQEGDANVNDNSRSRSRIHNVCQIFKKEVEVSGTIQAINLAGVPDEYNYQLANRTLELRRELGMSAYSSVKVTGGGAGGSDTVYRSMDGLRNFVRRQSAQLTTTSQALTESIVNSQYRLIYNQGGEADFAVGTADQMTYFSELYKDKIRLAPSDRTRGVFVTKFLTDLGVELDLVIDRWALPGDLIIGDTSKLRLVPLKGRGWQATPLAKTGDAMRGMLVGEYTLEVRNAAQSFSLHSGLTARG